MKSGELDVSHQGGFSLVELLVVIAVGILLLLGTFSLLDFGTRQAAGGLDRIETSQRARTWMEQLIQELHSSCVSGAVTPVQSGSSDTTLRFISQEGSGVTLTPSLHVVSFAGGSLTDQSYVATGGTAPSWTFSSTPSGGARTLDQVSQANPGSGTQPIFQYFTGTGSGVSTTPLSTPLSSSDAATVAEVTISFAVGPADGSTQADRSTNLSDSAVLELSPVASGATSSSPCQ